MSEQLFEVEIGHHESLDGYKMHDCVRMTDFDKTKTFDPVKEERLSRLQSDI